jgi:transposase-like protein
MPHARCSVCSHPQYAAIEDAIQKGGSVRELAKRFGLSPAAVHRHQHHGTQAKTRINIGQIAHIDEEIKKLIRAQNRAKKKRDTAGALAVARELRNWFVLRSKAEVAASAAQPEQSEQMSRTEAVGMSKLIIEAEVTAGSSEIIQWLQALLERAQPMNKHETERVPAVPIQSEE